MDDIGEADLDCRPACTNKPILADSANTCSTWRATAEFVCMRSGTCMRGARQCVTLEGRECFRSSVSCLALIFALYTDPAMF